MRRKVDGAMQDAFAVSVGGSCAQGEERLAPEEGVVLASEVSAFLVELGRAVDASGLPYEEWAATHGEDLHSILASHVM